MAPDVGWSPRGAVEVQECTLLRAGQEEGQPREFPKGAYQEGGGAAPQAEAQERREDGQQHHRRVPHGEDLAHELDSQQP
ncbi:hypothetical protein LINGRAHAP2_LOCUS32383 [Linum grandiflorum]